MERQPVKKRDLSGSKPGKDRPAKQLKVNNQAPEYLQDWDSTSREGEPAISRTKVNSFPAETWQSKEDPGADTLAHSDIVFSSDGQVEYSIREDTYDKIKIKNYDPAKDKNLQFHSTPPDAIEPYYPPKDKYPKTIEDAITEGKEKYKNIKQTKNYKDTRKTFLQRYKSEIHTLGNDSSFRLEVSVRGYESTCYEYLYSFEEEEKVLGVEAQYRHRPNDPSFKDRHDKRATKGHFDSEAHPFIIDENREKKFIAETEPLHAFEIRHNIISHFNEEYPHLNLKDTPPTSIRSMDVREEKTIHILEELMQFDSENEEEIVYLDKDSDKYYAIMAGHNAPTHARWLQQDHPDKEITQIIVKGTGGGLPEIEYIIK
jgi:hypothetical protein